MKIPNKYSYCLVIVASGSGDHFILFTKERITVDKILKLAKKYMYTLEDYEDGQQIEDFLGGQDTGDAISAILTKANIEHEIIDADSGNWYHGIG